MAASPDIFTDKWFIDYENSQNAHTVLVRTDPGVGSGQVDQAIEDWITSVTSLFCAATITAVRFQAQGTNFSFPSGSGLVGLTWGSGAATNEQDATAATWCGRSNTGRRTRLTLFGYKGSISNYRLTAAESVVVAPSVDKLTLYEGTFQAIDSVAPVWYNYIDIKANDYWVRRSRG